MRFPEDVYGRSLKYYKMTVAPVLYPVVNVLGECASVCMFVRAFACVFGFGCIRICASREAASHKTVFP